jgi:hypothetical protein
VKTNRVYLLAHRQKLYHRKIRGLRHEIGWEVVCVGFLYGFLGKLSIAARAGGGVTGEDKTDMEYVT